MKNLDAFKHHGEIIWNIANLPRDPYPNAPEKQRQIESFLDRRTSQIDALIAEKQELSQKLRQARLAEIIQTLTKGLNPDAPKRDSGIACLGDVLAHWEVKRFEFVARIGNGSTTNREEPSYWSDGSCLWLNRSRRNQETVTAADQFVTPGPLAECHLLREAT